ncbi:exodeoxyribonuclease VII large subunit [uncultured Ruminococcus sp.]|uniref:exodeoxyribonuclease VII large subunit n=1 Tax=uncultured Ruminococcus sp. TaxID=165186 RepID=UPI000EC7A7AE|nr:exodeoxyribonuclease VII large subunit [uncultured Ruminococcus sp.]HCJ41939.1 exodeoxyribonuclease VII large subunit [Ruminococcus sp.]
MSVLTVGQLNKLLAYKIKQELKFKGVAVKGEISNFSVHYKTGHAFFSIKDETGSIRCVMFSGRLKKLKALPADGMSVLVMGAAEVYERDAICQINVTDIAVLGDEGIVHAQNELVKDKLKKQGIFDASRKKPIPHVPKKLAVVTSLTGAALQDILNVAGRRYPLCTVEVYPATVQGDTAPASVCRAISKADMSGADTIILSRGGGSAEDLEAFNAEAVVLAVAACSTPVISAVGHEINITLTDYAADMRAPTPSAAAELATPDIGEIFSALNAMKARLDSGFGIYLRRRMIDLERLDTKLRAASPARRLNEADKHLDMLDKRLKMSMENRLRLSEMRLERGVSQLQMLSPFNVLNRGYTLVERDGRAVTSAADLSEGDTVSIRFADGCAEAVINKNNGPKG